MVKERDRKGSLAQVELPTTSLVDVLRVFQEYSEDPPGQDIYMASFYESILQKLSDKDPLAAEIVSTVLIERPHITPQYFANLFFRAIQYIELFKLPASDKYPDDLRTREAWDKELGVLFRAHGNDIKDILIHKDTATTIYQRYAGPQALLSACFNGMPLQVADFGCGGNLGLPGMSLKAPFDEIEDYTENQMVTELLTLPVKIERGVAVDKEDPHNPEAKKWRMACSFYPSEFGRLTRDTVFEERLTAAKNVSFFQSDLLTMQNGRGKNILLPGQFDAVIVSTILYQMTPGEQVTVLENAKLLLKPEGMIIADDFASKSGKYPAGLDFHHTRWHGKEWSYRAFIYSAATGWEPKEVLQWRSGRCRAVRAGEDFSLLETLRR